MKRRKRTEKKEIYHPQQNQQPK